MSNSLMATGSSVLEQRAAEACAVISNLSVPLRDLWNPWKCPATFLPYLAWAFSVDRWEETWTETEKRQAIIGAFWMHQRKGTIAAVRRVIEDMGFSVSLEEWWQVDDPAGTFRLEVDVNEVGLSSKSMDELNRLINETKPVSRHVSQLAISARVSGDICAGAALQGGEIITVYPEDVEPEDGIFYNGLFFHDGNVNYR